MNTTYTLTEGNDALNKVLLMMRYDMGKTLSENIILEQPESRFETQYNKDLIKKYDKPSKTMTLDEFMEDYRDALTHPVMVGLEVFLTSTGVGVGAVVAAYTALLAYDVYKGVVKKDWDWLNIVFDILGIVSSGVISGTLRPIMKGAQGLKLNTIGKVLTYLSKTKLWSKIKPLLEGGIDLLKSISKGIWKALSWISEKTGFRQLNVAGKSIEVMIHNIVYNIEEFLKSSVKKTIKFLEPGAKVSTKQGIKRGLVAGVVTQGIKRLDRYLNVKIPKWRNTDRESELTPFIVSENPEIYGKNIKFKDVDKEYGFEYNYLRDVKGNFYIYNIETNKYEKLNPENYEQAKIMFLLGGAYSNLKFNDFEIDKYDPKNPIYTINGVDYKMINNNFKLKKI
jgi:hypothetical protein